MKFLTALLAGTCAALAFGVFPSIRHAQAQEDGDGTGILMGDRDPELLLRVNAAVVKGVDWLLARQERDGGWPRAEATAEVPAGLPGLETVLAVLTLLKCGERPDSVSIEKGFVRPGLQRVKSASEAGLLLSAIEERFSPKSAPRQRGPRPRVMVPPAPRERMRECVGFLIENRVASGRTPGQPDRPASPPVRDVWNGPAGKGDHAETMFALLGLLAAVECGLELPDDVWTAALGHFLEVQEKSGPPVERWVLVEDKKTGRGWFKESGMERMDRVRGWCRDAAAVAGLELPDVGSSVTGSMTCAGLSCVSMALLALGPKCRPDLKASGEHALWDGLAWLERNWRIGEDPGQPGGRDRFFYLFCLARAAETTWMRAIGKRDWFREGAEWLLANQAQDGSWDDPRIHAPVANTCFALLFLARPTR
jgi:hypothetical protein